LRVLLRGDDALQNGVNALYAWIHGIVDAALLGRVTLRRPDFLDAGDEHGLAAILEALERVHPDLDPLVRAAGVAEDAGVASKLSICFRQIGVAVVRVSGRASAVPPL